MTRQRGQIYRQPSGLWAIRYRDAQGNRPQLTGYRTKTEAQEVREERLREVRLGAQYRPKATLRELYDTYLEQYDVAPSTVAFLKTMPRLARDEMLQLSPLSSSECRSQPASGAQQPIGYEPDERGAIVLRQYACQACHRIEGVIGPDAVVGPPLVDWPQRRYIAGTLPNTQENLARWIVDPDGVSPGTLMPDLGVTEAHAREMAAFLFRQE